jgi:hypothetical protein
MEGGRKRGRPRKRWLDDAEYGLQQLGARNWRLRTRDRVEVEDCSEGNQGPTGGGDDCVTSQNMLDSLSSIQFVALMVQISWG